jgi:hypothetical protein
MKKIIRKSFVVALIAMPMFSHAMICGGGKINGLALRGDGNLAIEMQFLPNYSSPQSLWEDNIMWTQLSGDKLVAVRSQLTAALHSGNFVRVYGGSDCVNVTSVAVCPSAAPCKIANYSW